MNIEIHPHDRFLAFDLAGTPSIDVGDEIQIADQVKLSFKSAHDIGKAFYLPEIVYFTLTFGSGVAAGVAANWLYDKLKSKRIKKLIIERTEVEIDQGEIKRVIEERLKIE